MSLDPQAFNRKPFTVMAVRVTEENLREIADWTRGTLVVKTEDGTETSFVKVPVRQAMTDRQTEAHPGDWVLKMGTSFKSYTDAAFTKNFVPEDPEALLGDSEIRTHLEHFE